ncbi:MAG TPA: hypothetical protein VHM25_01785, partial [Polyangiaceae bacterium]|nr:hypothetical protein [Polyangiaceae bacterium]
MPSRTLGRTSRSIARFALALVALPVLACESSSSSGYPAQYPQQPQPAGSTPGVTGVPSAPLPAGQSASLPAPGVPMPPVVNDP